MKKTHELFIFIINLVTMFIIDIPRRRTAIV